MNETRVASDVGLPTYRPTVVTMPDAELSLGDLVMGLTDDISELMRKEVELAKAELQENLKEGAKAGSMLAAGGMVAYAGLILILIALGVALGDWWDNMWLGLAVVGLVVAVAGWSIFNYGKNQLKNVSLVPRKTVSSLKSDARMAKEKMS